jgi:hypothetical protein
MNSTTCLLKLHFKEQVKDPRLGNPDVLFIDMKSRFVFVSKENRMPLSHTLMNFTLPLQVLPKDEV